MHLDHERPGGPELAFRCPGCDRAYRSVVDQDTARALGWAGVPTSRPSEDETGHPERPPAGPPLTYDDVLDLHELLATDDWFTYLLIVSEELAGRGRS